MFQLRHARLRQRLGDFLIEAARFDGEAAQVLVGERLDDELIAAADAQFLQQREGVQQGLVAALHDPRDFAFLVRHVADEQGAQVGQLWRVGDQRFHHFVGARFVRVAPHADDQRFKCVLVGFFQEAGDQVRHLALVVVFERKAVDDILPGLQRNIRIVLDDLFLVEEGGAFGNRHC